MASNLIPSPKWTVPGNSGNVAAGWKIFTYEVGNLVAKKTYTTAAQGTENTNPVILNSRGEADIWWNGDYKVIIKDENDNVIDTIDNYTAQIGDAQWGVSQTATFVNGASFDISGNVVGDYDVGRRVKITDASTLYGTIVSRGFSSPNTTVVVTLDSGNVSSLIEEVQLGILSITNPSLPNYAVPVYKGVSTGTANAIVVTIPEKSGGYVSGEIYIVDAIGTNTTVSPTVNVNGQGAKIILNDKAGAIKNGDIPTFLGYTLILKYNSSSNSFYWVNYSPKFRGALVYISSTFSTANGANTDVLFDSEVYDTDSIHDAATNTERLTVPVGVSKVKLHLNIRWDANTTGQRFGNILMNGATFYGRPSQDLTAAATGDTFINVSTSVIDVSSGDYFNARVKQTSGGSLTLDSVNKDTWFSMEIIE